MALRRLQILLATATLALGALACGDDGGGSADGGSTDAGRDSAGGDSGDAGDTGVVLPQTGESLDIYFVTKSRGLNPGEPEEFKLYITDEDCQDWPQNTCDATEVTGGNLTCEVECAVSSGLDYVLWMDPSSPRDLRIATLNGDLTVANDDRVLAQGVGLWQVGPERVVFSRSGELFAVEMSGGDAWRVASVVSQDGRALPGGFHYAPRIDRVIVNVPTSLSAMDLLEVGVGDPTQSRLLYHFVSDVEQTTGSFYQGQQEISVSPDGGVVTIFTDALDTTNACDPNAAATTCDAEYSCSSNSNRCIGEQLLLHVINRDQSNLLSVPGNANACTTDAECGQFHECDLSNPDATNAGVCVPGKLVVGPHGRFACQPDSAGGPTLDAGEYNSVHSSMWRSDGQLMFVGVNSCAGTNIDLTDLVAIDPGLGAMERIIENPGENHGGPDCYDDLEQEYTPQGCNVDISAARMSPSGQTVVFIANSVRSPTDTEAWLIDAWGRGGKDDLTRDILTDILWLGVYAP